MNMQTQSNEEQKDYMWSIIEKITKFLGVVIPFSILLGAVSIYLYLSKLGAMSLFYEIMSLSVNLLSIIISYSIIIFLCSSFLLILFHTPMEYKKNSGVKVKIRKDIILFYTLSPTLLYILHNSILKNIVSIYGLEIIVSCLYIITPPILTIIVYKNTAIHTDKFDKIADKITEYSIIYIHYQIITISYPILLYFINYFLVYLCGENYLYLISWIIVLFLFSAIYFNSMKLTSKLILIIQKIKRSSSINKLIVLFVIGISFFIIYNAEISPYILYNLGYIEKNTDARWYLLDTRFINQYGLVKKEGTTGLNDKDTLIEWQKKFSVNDKIDSKMDNNQTDYSKTYKNAVYGYMAWNLGKTKIFCPHDVTIENEKTLDKVCLTINGDYLQPIPDGLRFVK